MLPHIYIKSITSCKSISLIFSILKMMNSLRKKRKSTTHLRRKVARHILIRIRRSFWRDTRSGDRRKALSDSVSDFKEAKERIFYLAQVKLTSLIRTYFAFRKGNKGRPAESYSKCAICLARWYRARRSVVHPRRTTPRTRLSQSAWRT